MLRSPDNLVLESIVTTEAVDGGLHVAPMGPEVNLEANVWWLKPFQTSTTFANLRRTQRCVVHVTDDSLLLVKAVLGLANQEPATFVDNRGYRLAACCRWFALEVVSWELQEARALAECRVVDSGEVRPFFGWNRAKHALVELAVLASRLSLLAPAVLQAEWERLAVLVEKTGGRAEHQALEMLRGFMGIDGAGPVESSPPASGQTVRDEP
jgi:hypothetical protein